MRNLDWSPVVVTARRGALCREILASLPDWFGIPASVDAYVEGADGLPMLACFANDGVVAGFLSLKVQTKTTTEIFVMGVKPDRHRCGVGRALIEAAAAQAASHGATYLTVKTLAPTSRSSLCTDTRVLRDQWISAGRDIPNALGSGVPLPVDDQTPLTVRERPFTC
jgi:GNAT superfamily N-acetyltransferase